ncbi:MAG: DNA polymerase III subunit beta [Clostridiales bacterium]|nr:DNA polymerase III subunit beta [Clostridiales bacterium]
MKFYCNGMDLSNATNIVSRALAVNKNIPILEGIKIYAKADTVTFSAYNQELYIEKQIKAEILIEGEVVVNGKLFNDYANKLSSQERIAIEKGDNNKISILFNSSQAEITYYDIENFPPLGNYNDDISIKIKESDFKQLIEKVIFCASLNDTRLLLKSCNMEVIDNYIEAVCLDGYRVAISRNELIEKKGQLKFIILGKILSDISKILDDSDNEITISRVNNMIVMDLGHTKIRTTTVEGDFYNYRNNLPQEINNVIIINKEELESCLSRVSIISKDLAFNRITITIEEGKFNIFSESEKGRVNETIDCKAEGEKIRIGLNSKYLMDAILRIKEDYLKIEIERAIKPILVKRVEGDDYKCVILPLRLIG